MIVFFGILFPTCGVFISCEKNRKYTIAFRCFISEFLSIVSAPTLTLVVVVITEKSGIMQWISNTWETVKRENFLNWFVSPPRKPSIREISQDRKRAKRTSFRLVEISVSLNIHLQYTYRCQTVMEGSVSIFFIWIYCVENCVIKIGKRRVRLVYIGQHERANLFIKQRIIMIRVRVSF